MAKLSKKNISFKSTAFSKADKTFNRIVSYVKTYADNEEILDSIVVYDKTTKKVVDTFRVVYFEMPFKFEEKPIIEPILEKYIKRNLIKIQGTLVYSKKYKFIYVLYRLGVTNYLKCPGCISYIEKFLQNIQPELNKRLKKRLSKRKGWGSITLVGLDKIFNLKNLDNTILKDIILLRSNFIFTVPYFNRLAFGVNFEFIEILFSILSNTVPMEAKKVQATKQYLTKKNKCSFLYDILPITNNLNLSLKYKFKTRFLLSVLWLYNDLYRKIKDIEDIEDKDLHLIINNFGIIRPISNRMSSSKIFEAYKNIFDNIDKVTGLSFNFPYNLNCGNFKAYMFKKNIDFNLIESVKAVLILNLNFENNTTIKFNYAMEFKTVPDSNFVNVFFNILDKETSLFLDEIDVFPTISKITKLILGKHIQLFYKKYVPKFCGKGCILIQITEGKYVIS